MFSLAVKSKQLEDPDKLCTNPQHSSFIMCKYMSGYAINSKIIKDMTSSTIKEIIKYIKQWREKTITWLHSVAVYQREYIAKTTQPEKNIITAKPITCQLIKYMKKDFFLHNLKSKFYKPDIEAALQYIYYYIDTNLFIKTDIILDQEKSEQILSIDSHFIEINIDNLNIHTLIKMDKYIQDEIFKLFNGAVLTAHYEFKDDHYYICIKNAY